MCAIYRFNPGRRPDAIADRIDRDAQLNSFRIERGEDERDATAPVVAADDHLLVAELVHQLRYHVRVGDEGVIPILQGRVTLSRDD